MFTSLAPSLVHPRIKGLFFNRSNLSNTERDLHALLDRMRHRLYPETIPALATFWMKTLFASGYGPRQWRELAHLLKTALRGPLLDDPAQEIIIQIQRRIQATVALSRKAPDCRAPGSEAVRPRLSSEGVPTYIARLLNEWLPAEAAQMLINESDPTEDGGIPVLEIAIAIERLLVREHLPRETLEMLPDSELLSPESVYPADLEVFRDVVLSLLGRTLAPKVCLTPAALLCVAPDSHFPMGYREVVRHACVARRFNREELRVPIAPALVAEMTQHERVKIGSIVVTMDGRWWEAENLQCGDQHCVVYRPGGRLRIGYSGGHAVLKVPWPENRLRWSGIGYPTHAFRIFGREWQVSKWEVNSARTWLHLVFSRVLPMSEIDPAASRDSWRLQPASVDMAWAALERALCTSFAQRSNAPIEQLRHPDLIPLGRAIVGLTESVHRWRPVRYEVIERHLKALRYLESAVASTYGRVPWRVLPASVRTTFLKVRRYPALPGLLAEVFEGLPRIVSGTIQTS